MSASERFVGLELDTQKDVYETPDVPAAAAALAGAGDDGAGAARKDIATDKIDVAAARTAFRRAEQGLPPAGATPGQTVYEVLAGLRDATVVETPAQRLQRLKLEVVQLAQDLGGQSDTAVLDKGVVVRDAKEQMHALDAQLQLLGQRVDGTSGAAAPSAATRLVQQLQHLLREQAAKPAAAGGAGGAAVSALNVDAVVYELFFSSDLARQVLDEHVVQLDSRVAALEKAVGNPAAVNLAAGSLAATVAALGQRLALLEPRQLESLATRVKLLLPDLDRMAMQRKPTVDADTDGKINALFERLDRWDPLVHTLPTLVDRLRSLQHVHQSAIGLVDTVQAVARSQGQLSEQLKAHEALLAKVEAGLAANSATVQRNIDVLDKRVSDLLARTQALSTK